MHTIEDPRCDEGTKGVANDVAAIEDSCSEAKLASFVPFTNQEEGSREEGCFDETEEEAGEERADEAEGGNKQIFEGREKASALCSNTGQRGNHPPDDHAAWEIDRWFSDVVQQHVTKIFSVACLHMLTRRLTKESASGCSPRRGYSAG